MLEENHALEILKRAPCDSVMVHEGIWIIWKPADEWKGGVFRSAHFHVSGGRAFEELDIVNIDISWCWTFTEAYAQAGRYHRELEGESLFEDDIPF
jgi:hypothetical protein